VSGSCKKRQVASEWSIANVIDDRGLLAELVSSSAAKHAIGPEIRGLPMGVLTESYLNAFTFIKQ
jgi:hypothetical protein